MFELDKVKQDFCDPSNERALLALAVNDVDSFYSLLSKISEGDFLSPDSARLYNIITTLHSTGVKRFDKHAMVKVAEELGYGDLCDINYINAVTNVNIAKENFDVYLARQLDISTKYKLNVSLESSLNAVRQSANLTSGKTSSDLLSSAQADLLNLSTTSLAIEEPRHVSDGLDDYIDSIKDVRIELRGISTGYPVLDKLIDGQIPGTLFIIAARKKMGKSTLLTNMALHSAAREHRSVLYVDTEMPFEQWRSRAIAIMSGVKERTILHGGFASNKETMFKITQGVKLLKESGIFHHYLPGYSIDKLAALYQKYKLQENIELGIFDYIKEPDSSSTEAGRKEYQILGDVTTKLKDLSGQLDIPFSAAVQVNRTGDVADSDRVARYGDIVAFWEYRDKKLLEEVLSEKLEGQELEDKLREIGHYQLNIKDSRRGGTTPATGIGFYFKKEWCQIKEVPLNQQLPGLFYDSGIDMGLDTLAKASEVVNDSDQLL